MNRSVRLSYLQRLFYRRPDGYRSSELARLCGVDRRTINRDLADLGGEPFYLPLELEGWRWRLMEGHRFTLPPVQLSLRARASAPDIPGTWGFGLWNDPFAASLGFAGATRTVPALPQAAWYFHASAPNYLALREGCPPHDFLAATFASILLARAMLAAGLLVLPAFVVPAAAGLLRALARRIVRQDARLLTADPCEWHSHQLTWSAAAVRFILDEEEIFVTSVSPQGPLGLVLWIDNQYMALPPGGRLRAGYLPADQPAWLELAELAVSSPTQP